MPLKSATHFQNSATRFRAISRDVAPSLGLTRIFEKCVALPGTRSKQRGTHLYQRILHCYSMLNTTISNDNELLRSLGLVVDEAERVLICTHASCGYALQVHDKRVSRHVYEKHKVPKASRRGLDRLVASLDLRDPRTVEARANGSVPHPLLHVSPGFACRQCGNLTISLKLHQQHLCSSRTSVNLKGDGGSDHHHGSVLL